MIIGGDAGASVTVRHARFDDLTDLDWSGGPEHLAAVARALQAAAAGGVVLLVGELPNGRLVAQGAVDFRVSSGTGDVWMLAVHELVQSCGIGTAMIAELERRAADRGCRRVRISVEHDNPAAARLYRRLGYVETGSRVESWPVAGGTYVTVSTVLQRAL